MFQIKIYKKKKIRPFLSFGYEDTKKGKKVFEFILEELNSQKKFIKIENIIIDKEEIQYIIGE